MDEVVTELDEDESRSSETPARDEVGARRRHRWKTFRRRVGRALGLSIGPTLIRILASTWRGTVEGQEHVDGAHTRGGYFMALWHGRMLIPAVRHSRQGYSVLVSKSGDGDVSEALLGRLGYGIVRGSTGRGARAALREMLRQLRAGTPIAITPDGPRGPPHSISPGMAWMASATKHPVIPCGFVAANAWHLASWDRFTIPKPFSRVAFVYGEPFQPTGRDGDELARESAEIRARILLVERRAFELLGVEPDG